MTPPRALKEQLKGVKVAKPTPKKPARDVVAGTTAQATQALSDAELFARAVAGVSQDAVLEKYDSTAPKTAAPKKTAADKKTDDASLFESFVGPVDKPTRG